MKTRLRRYISQAKRNSGDSGPYENLLSATVKDSGTNDFSTTNVVLASGYHPLIVVASALDSAGNSFTIFS